MSLFAIVGLPGSGKSHDAVCRIVETLKGFTDKEGKIHRRVVASNIDGLDDPKCIQQIKNLTGLSDAEFPHWFIFLQKSDVLSFWVPRLQNVGTEMEFLGSPLVPPGSLVFLDEVHKWINSREWNTDGNKRFCEWAAEHRHDGYDVMLITQDINKLDKQVRSLIDCTYFFRKLNFMGSLGKNKYVEYYYEGGDHEGKPDCPPKTKGYNKYIFKCYHSYKSSAITEKQVVKRYNVLKHPVFFAIPVVVCFAIYSVMHSTLASGDVFGQKARMKRAEEIQNQARLKASIPAPVVVPAPVPVVVPATVPAPSLAKFAPVPGLAPASSFTVPVPPVVPGVKPLPAPKPLKLPKWKTIKITADVVIDSVHRYFSGDHDITDLCGDIDPDVMTVAVRRSVSWGVLAESDPGYKTPSLI